ncbi:Crp/Fnr family transcriptional regulator [Amycolatopsis sp. QT-25]|uniref:Crp/Fnr family transcriptional regulator n=1 Tax=Amycolatopsis sp. QT-25 TaxID=3034022 RepID=UPI0023EAD6C7|nr:Crp/Fnr family transcriptional regulator [Amycolatopsis sp. QT-25]WET77299.1 Crp/Fnr family transcriptional regulator [Amycolatopsis sp. QT-25]
MNVEEWPPRSLLGVLGRRSKETLLGLGTPITYPAHQRIVRQGESARYTVLVLAGLVKIVVGTERGKDVVIAVRGPGDLIGEMAALERRPRSAHVIACVPVQAKVIHSRDLVEFLERSPETSLALAKVLSGRLRGSDRRGVDLIAYPAPIRIARTLLEVTGRWGETPAAGQGLAIPLSQRDIASLAGTGLSSVEKAFRQLEEGGALDRHYRRVLITDVDRLRRFGELSDEIPY